MKAWSWWFAIAFGAAGAGIGTAAASGAGMPSQQPIWALEAGLLFAILGAILGGVADVVKAINETRRP